MDRTCKTHTQIAGGPPGWGTSDGAAYAKWALCCADDGTRMCAEFEMEAGLSWSSWNMICAVKDA